MVGHMGFCTPTRSLVDGQEEGSERTTVNGDSGSERLASELGPGCQSLEGTRNVNIESLYEYGSRAGVWRILRLLKEYNIRCTSYMIGQALLMNPEVGRWLVQGGHEVSRCVDSSVMESCCRYEGQWDAA